jgi:hypothetical protein
MSGFQGNAPVVFRGVSFVTATRVSKDPQVGTIKIIDNDEYVFVYNDCNSQIVPTNVCIPQSGMSIASVTLSSTSGAGKAFGICKHATIPTASYGYLLKRGTATINGGADASFAAGGSVGIGDAGLAGLGPPIFGQALSAIASGASGGAFVSMY